MGHLFRTVLKEQVALQDLQEWTQNTRKECFAQGNSKKKEKSSVRVLQIWLINCYQMCQCSISGGLRTMQTCA